MTKFITGFPDAPGSPRTTAVPPGKILPETLPRELPAVPAKDPILLNIFKYINIKAVFYRKSRTSCKMHSGSAVFLSPGTSGFSFCFRIGGNHAPEGSRF